MKLGEKDNKKMIKTKQIIKINQIWYKNKSKSNVKRWIWKRNSIRKGIKKEMDEIENKIQLGKG
jgi:hypothetical protein